MRVSNSMARLLARARLALAVAWLALLVLDAAVVQVPTWLILGLLVLVFAVYYRVGTLKVPPRPVRPPVEGLWRAMHSPADRVPSHGLHAYGQTYAIDLVHVNGGRPDQGPFWPLSHPPQAFSAFGEPVLSPVDGTVVRVRDSARDHRSRTSWPAIAYFFVEAALRELMGAGRILGNHVIVKADDGVYALVCHLQKGSALVREGDQVAAGRELARCGNTGNSTEPHVHFQLMDCPRPSLAAGLPFVFSSVEQTGWVPRSGEVLVAGGAV